MRFGFGKNWSNYLQLLTEERIAEAVRSLQAMLQVDTLSGLNFIDIGSGSGLFSLAAHKLGANVFSFDYDADSVACTAALKSKFAPESERWRVSHGSVLDSDFLKSLGTFDIVYSWGVLHHTGEMWKALENVVGMVKPHGKLFIAIYNDQGLLSKYWLFIKRAYNGGGPIVRVLLLAILGAWEEFTRFAKRLLEGKNPFPWAAWKEKKKDRGMSIWYDHVDWVGGYPFEVAKPEQIFSFYHTRGFQLKKLVTKRGGHGCCEYVFERE